MQPPSSLKIWKLAIADLKFCDAHSLNFADDKYDLVFSNTVLHFLFDPVKALEEQKRVCKKGGFVIAADVRDWDLSPR